MKSIDFADEVIEVTNTICKDFTTHLKSISKNYSQVAIKKCFDKIVNLFENYDRNKPSEFSAYLNCLKDDKFDDPIVVFPLRENNMEIFIDNIIACDKDNLLIIEWMYYLEKNNIEWFPFHLVGIGKRGDFNNIDFSPNKENEISIIFRVDRKYKMKEG